MALMLSVHPMTVSAVAEGSIQVEKQSAEAQEEPAAGEAQETYAPERETSETEN